MSRKSWSANEMLGFEALQITGQLVPVKKAGLAGLARYREDHHMLLEADQSSMVGRDGDPMRLQSVDGLPLSVPGDIGGMSGAAVWGFVKWDVDPEKWTKDSWKVVGFQHAVDRNEGLIRVTRANRLLHLLRQFPSASVVIDALY